jgi:siroheme synthase
LTFVTGHISTGRDEGLIDWSGITGPGKTTVVYMGLGQAENIRTSLIGAGISRDTPVALICDGTRDTQQTLGGTIDSLPGLAQMANKGVPGILIIGQVAALSSNLAWFEEQFSFRSAA